MEEPETDLTEYRITLKGRVELLKHQASGNADYDSNLHAILEEMVAPRAFLYDPAILSREDAQAICDAPDGCLIPIQGVQHTHPIQIIDSAKAKEELEGRCPDTKDLFEEKGDDKDSSTGAEQV